MRRILQLLRKKWKSTEPKAVGYDPQVYKERIDNFFSEDIQLKNKKGLEFGPFDRPLFPQENYDVIYADVFSTEELVQRAHRNPARNPAAVCPIHINLANTTLADYFAGRDKVDFVACNHMVEHVPNVIGWLHEVAAILNPAGRILIVYPDRRYTYDILRPFTSIAALLDRDRRGLKKPAFDIALEYFIYHRQVRAGQIWNRLVDPKDLTPTYPYSIAAANAATSDFKYVDIHCNVFSDTEFVETIRYLSANDLIPFNLLRIEKTSRPYLDFLAILEKKSSPLTPRPESLTTHRPSLTLEKKLGDIGPMIFFMHIAKTAGSLLNQIVTDTVGPDQVVVHCERFLRNAEFSDQIRTHQFISGHVYIRDWEYFCNKNGHKTVNITCIREPISQLVSHLRWIDHYNMPEVRGAYLALDKMTQEVVDRIHDVDFDDPGSIDHFLTNLPPRGVQYFDNCQSRYFLCGGRDGRFDPISLNSRPLLSRAIKRFQWIGVAETFEHDLGLLGKLVGLPLQYNQERVNEGRSARRIDTTKPLMRRVLQKRLILDDWLYQFVLARHRKQAPAPETADT
jgi:hypothetical protein